MKTPVTHDQMIKMFENSQAANIEIIHAMRTAVNATTKSETDRIDVKLDGVILRQDKANDSVAKNVKAITLNNETTEKVDGSRTGANARAFYKNKTSIANDAQVSSIIPNGDFSILARNYVTNPVSSFTRNQVSAAFAGSGMTQTNVNNFTDRLETFMDAIGAGVIT